MPRVPVTRPYAPKASKAIPKNVPPHCAVIWSRRIETSGKSFAIRYTAREQRHTDEHEDCAPPDPRPVELSSAGLWAGRYFSLLHVEIRLSIG